MMTLMTRAAHEFDVSKGIFVLDLDVLLYWLNVLERRDANTYPQQKEEAYQEVAHSYTIAAFATHSCFPQHVPKDPLEGGGERD